MGLLETLSINNMQHNGTQYLVSSCLVAERHGNLNVMLSVVNAECRYAECRYAEFRYAECRYAECRYAECRYARCHYTECHCRGALY
jgi:hypothetical protein